MPLRLVFMGTPDFAVPTLLEIVGRGYDVVAVYSRAPKPGGRRGLIGGNVTRRPKIVSPKEDLPLACLSKVE